MNELTPGQIVSGVVVQHQAFGLFVDIGQEKLAVVTITTIADDPHSPNPAMPPVGERIEAVFLAYAGPGRQPRLSLRPRDLEQSRKGVWDPPDL